MAWENTLLDASFRGVEFETLKVDDSGGHDVARHAFPYCDGQETEDLGVRAREIRISAYLYGDEYESALAKLVEALEDDGPGELIHPIYGSMTVQPMEWHISHQADDIDQCRVEITFCETDEPSPIFEQINQRLAAAALADSDEAVSSAATEAYVADMAKPSLRSQLNAIRSVLQKTIGQIYAQARDITHSALDVINFPRLLVSDLIQGVAAILALGESLDPKKIFAQWRSLSDDAKALLKLPTSAASEQSRPPSAAAMQPVTRLMSVVVVSQYAATVGELLTSEAETATLSPEQIETIVNDVRTMIETVVIDLRDATDLDAADKLERYRPVVEALKNQALLLQNAAKSIIEQRPPLIERAVTSPGNLHLIAHRWYGDYRRADELLRLNPQIRQPNFVLAGTVLKAYAE